MLKIIGINIVLSGDNAVVIALACRALPRGQRLWASSSAPAPPSSCASSSPSACNCLDIPALKLVGGLILFWIAIKLLVQEEANEKSVASAHVVGRRENGGDRRHRHESRQRAGYRSRGEGALWLIIFGLPVSIPLIVAGATLIMALLSRFPILVWAGAGLLGWVAGELLTEARLQALPRQARHGLWSRPGAPRLHADRLHPVRAAVRLAADEMASRASRRRPSERRRIGAGGVGVAVVSARAGRPATTGSFPTDRIQR